MAPVTPAAGLGLDPVILGTILSGVAAFMVICVLYMLVSPSNAMGKRIRTLNGRRDALKQSLSETRQKRRHKITHRNDTAEQVRNVMDKMRLIQDEQLSAAKLKLSQAGVRSPDIAVTIILGRAVLPIVLGLTAFLCIYVFDIWPDMTPFKRFGYTAAALILGYKGPDIYVNNLINRRMDAIRKGLPDALDLLVICAEAGLTIDAAFSRVAKELGRAYPELADEFGMTSVELGFLTERRMAFQNLAMRIPLDSVKGVSTTMIQTEKYGTPLASALRVLSAEFRNERMMRAEEKAARLPAIMTVPLILFILPALFIIILGPAACSILDSF